MLTVVSLSKRFGSTQAVDNVSFDLEPGAAVALLGPSGSGKTTVLRLIAGFEEPDAGEVRIHGEIVSCRGKITPPHTRNIGFVFQQPTLWPHMTVWRHLLFAARDRRDRATMERLQLLLNLTGLQQLAGRFPGELSGGQARRVGLARALAARPRLLLMDEPMTNLDSEAKEELQAVVLTAIRECGCGLLYVTHDQSEAEAMTTRFLQIVAGRMTDRALPR